MVVNSWPGEIGEPIDLADGTLCEMVGMSQGEFILLDEFGNLLVTQDAPEALP